MAREKPDRMARDTAVLLPSVDGESFALVLLPPPNWDGNVGQVHDVVNRAKDAVVARHPEDWNAADLHDELRGSGWYLVTSVFLGPYWDD